MVYKKIFAVLILTIFLLPQTSSAATPSFLQHILNPIESLASVFSSLFTREPRHDQQPLSMRHSAKGPVFGPFENPNIPKDGPATIVGTIVEAVGESPFEGGERSDHFFFIYDKVTNTVLELRPHNSLPPGLANGALVRASGQVNRGVLNTSPQIGSGAEISVIEPAPELATQLEGAGAAREYRVGVIVGNFTDRAIECTNNTINSTMFGTSNSVREAYLSTSNGELGITGNIHGPFNINYSYTGTSFNTWGSALRAAAIANGINLDQYDSLLYVLPNNNVTYAGYAYYGGDAYVFRCGMKDLYEHEIGHSLNLRHAQSGTNEYGDRSSFMGYSNIGLRHVNAPYMVSYGWLPDTSIQAVSGSRQYQLSAMDAYPGNVTKPQVLTIPKTDTNETYYIAYRTADRYGAGSPAGYRNKTMIYRWPGYGNTQLVGQLLDGASFVDNVNGITVTQLSSVAGNSATLNVSTNCSRNAPGVKVLPTEIGAAPGGSVEYQMTVTNNDSAFCGDSNIVLTVSDGSTSLTSTVSRPNLTLSPGTSNSVLVTAVSNTSIAGGSYPITVTAAANGLQTSQIARYSIDSQSPTTPANLTAEAQRKEVSLNWNAASDNVAVAGYDVFRNSTKIGTTQSTIFSDKFPLSGTNVYEVLAFDAAGNQSSRSQPASATFSSGGGKGGGKSSNGSEDGGTDTPDSERCTPWPKCR